MKVKLDNVIEALELYSEESHYFYNVKTEEIIYVSSDDLRIAEDDNMPNNLPAWQKDEVETAIDIVENFDDYINLPSQYDIDEYEIMSEFCCSLENEKISNELCDTIIGRGAFKRFRNCVERYGIEKQWYAFKDKAIHDMAIEWCNYNNITPIM